ncbi:MAG: hypothetical protein IPP06_10135 [Saprospiraceae bacterium]|nr:hypothetical protein [Candidatus Vicinibacter affinis]
MLGAKYDNNAEHATFSKDGKFIYFISAVNACNQIMMQDIATAKVKQLTTGIHDYQSILVSPKGLIGSRVSMTNPAEIYSIHGMTGEAVQLTQINKSVWDKIKKAEVRQKWVQTTDGKKCWCGRSCLRTLILRKNTQHCCIVREDHNLP